MLEWSLVVSKRKKQDSTPSGKSKLVCTPNQCRQSTQKRQKQIGTTYIHGLRILRIFFKLDHQSPSFSIIFTHHLWNHQKPWVSQWHVDVFPSKTHFVLLVEHIDSWWVLDHVLNPQRTSWHLGNLTSPAKVHIPDKVAVDTGHKEEVGKQ